MRKKKLKVKHVFIIIVTIVIVIVAIFSYTIKEDRELNKFEAFIKDGVTSVEKIVFYPFKVVINGINNYKELKDIRKKYQGLLPEVERIDSLNAENIELRKQLTKMKEELDIDYTVNDYEFLNATVISRNINHWYNDVKYYNFKDLDTNRAGVMDPDFNILVDGLKSATYLQEKYFTYLNGFKYGLMDYEGNVLLSYSIFDTMSEDSVRDDYKIKYVE